MLSTLNHRGHNIGGVVDEDEIPSNMNPKLRYFIVQSRKKQTLYANTVSPQGRKFTRDSENELKEFIKDSIFSEADREEVAVADKSEDILRRIVSTVKNRHGFNKGIRLSVAWVYYCDYCRYEERCFPVFKIYTATGEKPECFLDCQGREFLTWDRYLDAGEFPSSLLCLPRNGEYGFHPSERTLELEFLTSVTCNIQENSFSLFRSYIDTIRPWLREINELGREIKVQIKNIYNWTLDFWDRYKVPICKGLLFLLFVVAKALIKGGTYGFMELGCDISFWGKYILNTDWTLDGLLNGGLPSSGRESHQEDPSKIISDLFERFRFCSSGSEILEKAVSSVPSICLLLNILLGGRTSGREINGMRNRGAPEPAIPSPRTQEKTANGTVSLRTEVVDESTVEDVLRCVEKTALRDDVPLVLALRDDDSSNRNISFLPVDERDGVASYFLFPASRHDVGETLREHLDADAPTLRSHSDSPYTDKIVDSTGREVGQVSYVTDNSAVLVLPAGRGGEQLKRLCLERRKALV